MILGAPSQGRDDTAVRGKNWSNGRIYDGYEELFNSGCVSRQAQTAGLDARQPHHGESSVLKTLYDFNTFQPLRDAPESPSLSQASLASTRMIEWSPDRTASHHVSPPVMPDFPREERGSLVVEAQAPAIQPPPRASRRNSEGAVCAFRQFPPHIHIEGQELGQQAPSAQQEGPQQHPLPASSPSLQGSTTPKVPRVLFAGKRRSLTDLPSSPVGALTAPQREPEAPGAKGEDRREFWLRESVGGIGILLTDCLAGMKIRKEAGTLQVGDVLVSMAGIDVWDQKLVGIVTLLCEVHDTQSVVMLEFERQSGDINRPNGPKRMTVSFALTSEGNGRAAKVWESKDGPSVVL